MRTTSDDEHIRAEVLRLSRPHPSGGRVIERAAVMAAGTDAPAILAWLDAHGGEAEALTPAAAGRGLHGVRETAPGGDMRKPLRYVISADELSAP